MPKYVYSAKKIDGEKIKGSIEAKNKGAAISQLRKQENFCDIAVYLEGEMLESHRIEIISGWAIGGYIAFLVAMFIGLSGILSPLALFLGIMAIRKGDKFNGWLCALAGGIGCVTNFL